MPAPTGDRERARYIVAQGLRERQPAVTRFLFQLNDAFNGLKVAGKIAGTADRDDVLTILPVQQMLEDAPFLQYLRASNLRSVSASAPPPRSGEPGGRSRRLMCAAAKRG